MAEIITCPGCQRNLHVPDTYYGQSVQCPECRHTFVADPVSASVSATPPPVSVLPPRDDDRPKQRRDDVDDGVPDALPIMRRRGVPHRGGLILGLGIAGLVTPCTAIICGPLAWMLGSTDLAEIRAGRMDPDGEGMTQAGRIMGIISTGLVLLGFLLLCLIFASTLIRHG